MWAYLTSRFCLLPGVLPVYTRVADRLCLEEERNVEPS
jgi:hypothetical protein